MVVISEETWYKSTGDEKIEKKPLRAKSVKVLSEETQYKSTRDENERATEGKIRDSSL